MKIFIIQPLLPKYDIDFFNLLCKKFPQLQITILADIETKNSLNQVDGAEINFALINLKQTFLKGIVLRPKLFQLLSANKPDLVIFNGNPRDISQIAALLYCKTRKIRTFVWGMFHRIGGLRSFTKFYYKYCGIVADRCMTYSEVGATTLINLGIAKDKINIVGTAINESIPLQLSESITDAEISGFLESHGLLNKKIILQVVRLTEIKKPQLLIQAARKLLKHREDVIFVLIGDGPLRKKLEDLVDEYAIRESVLFIGALYDEEKLALWYKSAYAFVVPTCIGLSAHHAFSYGLPVITDDSLDNQASESSILYNGLNALLYSEGDIDSLCDKITALIDSAELKNRLSSNAVHTVKNIHSMERKLDQFYSCLS